MEEISLFPESIFIGLFVAVVGYFLQQRSWKIKLQEEIRQREFDECIKLVDELSKAIDKRLISISTFLPLVRTKSASQETLEEYRSGIFEWMGNFSSFKSKIFHYFGREKMLTFENEVHDILRSISDIVLRTRKYGNENLSRSDRKEFEEIESRIAFARYVAFKFLRELNEMISNGEIGRTSLFNNVNVGKLDYISRLYLIQRLLKLKG